MRCPEACLFHERLYLGDELLTFGIVGGQPQSLLVGDDVIGDDVCGVQTYLVDLVVEPRIRRDGELQQAGNGHGLSLVGFSASKLTGPGITPFDADQAAASVPSDQLVESVLSASRRTAIQPTAG